MCGLAGCARSDGPAAALTAMAQKMANAIAHRGPDDSGVWVDEVHGVALAHRRLSILDLSPAGHQPMQSACGRYVIAFNGEIYNHMELRHELEQRGAAPIWRGHSDTETMLAAFVRWGIVEAVRRMTGMFAFALWDRETKTLTLARDRIGEKPLYYGWQNGVFMFASELKALKIHTAFQGEVDRNALTLLLRLNYIPAPHSIYRGISKLCAGTILTLDAAGKTNCNTYWSAREVAERGVAEPFMGSDIEAADTLEKLLSAAVGRQMISDVPLGAFLSGGIDSSTIVALMQAQSSRPVKTFTIGFHEEGYDEAVHARAVASHLGTDHTELYVTPRDALDVIPRLPHLYDEPLSDASQIPTFLVSQLARRHVTVSLSGDGGDELFGGYNHYFMASSLWQKLGWIPRSARCAIATAIRSAPPSSWNNVMAMVNGLLPNRLRHANPGDKLQKLADILGFRTADELYFELLSQWHTPASVVLGSTEPQTVLSDKYLQAKLDDYMHRMMYFDTVSYLADDILAKVDRAAMGVSLETRVPLLDHTVVEFAWRLPLAMKIRDGRGKLPLREVLYRHVPRELVERPKAGFSMPIGTWLCGPLREWAEGLMAEDRLRHEGFFDPASIRRKWAEHLSGQRNWQYLLWGILMFQAWLEIQE
jgi:asparagine synthase (glutamine-hydrolysing)